MADRPTNIGGTNIKTGKRAVLWTDGKWRPVKEKKRPRIRTDWGIDWTNVDRLHDERV